LSTNSSTAPATITPLWSAPADSGGGAITYEWNFTQGIAASGTTGGTSGTGQSVGAGDFTFQVRACNPGGCSSYASAAVHIATPPSSGVVADGGYINHVKNSKNPSDPNLYYWHYLSICVSNLTAGNYTLNFSNDGAANYKQITLALPASGCVATGQQGGTSTSGGVSTDWFQIEVVGQFFTPHYTPWT